MILIMYKKKWKGIDHPNPPNKKRQQLTITIKARLGR